MQEKSVLKNDALFDERLVDVFGLMFIEAETWQENRLESLLPRLEI